MPKWSPVGRRRSPLGADAVAAGRVSLSELQSDGRALYWLESRPREGGRVVLVRWRDGTAATHSPTGVSIRSRVHEYGGGAVTLVPRRGEGAFAYVDQSDQRVWFCGGADATPVPLTAEPPSGETWNHGGLSASNDGRWVLAVRETHGDAATAGHTVVRRGVISLGVDGAEPIESLVLSGHDFYGTARLDAAAGRLAATAWDHPDMPWDASRVVIARTERHGSHLIAAGDPWELTTGTNASVGQPSWRHDGALRFVCDRTGWWQPYLHSGDDDGRAPHPLADGEAEFHGPDWNLGQRTMADLADGSLVARMTIAGRDALVRWPAADAGAHPPLLLEQRCVSIATVVAHGDHIAYIGTTPDAPTTVYVRAATPSAPSTPTSTQTSPIPRADIAIAHPIHLTGRTGRPVHASFYRPAAPTTANDTAGTAPPLIVICHGGPTANSPQGYDPAIQFFTTRGFAVATPDYAGSTGYGRAYRDALNGQWGIADADDCLDTALHLACTGAVDPSRMAVRGSSAGGFTALNALAAGEGFAACTSWYGVTDLFTLSATTHDFEAHYTDRLVGPLPEAADLYRARSPLTHAATMTGAVLLLQGAEDPVVPAAQAQQLHDALLSAGRICELHIFDGEGHGFRRADTLQAAYEAELAFYRIHLRL